ncbi:MAG: glycosyltransferase family 4 protein [Desulfobulbaceae bacterium]|nr:glycosyltransferase family 4 protein [Desulfobulbaceae bacterium]
MPPQKKILFITREIVPFYYGGIGTLFKALAGMLSAKGHKISFLSQAHGNFDQKIFRQEYGQAEIHFVDSPSPDKFPMSCSDVGKVSSFQFTYNLAVAEKFDRIVSESPPDIVISADFGAEGLFVMAKARLGHYPGIRFILHISGSLYHLMTVYESGCVPPMPSKLQDPQNRLMWAMEDGCIPLAPEIIVPTLWTWKETQKRIKVETNLHVIPNYPDKSFSLSEKEQNSQTNRANNILFIGRLDRCKGADLLLKLFIKFHLVLPSDTTLTFIGRDCACKEYNSTFLQYWKNRIPASCMDKIKFLGQVDHSQVNQYLQEAKLCIFPSRWEVFGLVCLEAMAHGVPILVSKDTGPAEVLGPELENYAFDFENDTQQIITTIQALCADPTDNRQLRKKMRERARILKEQTESAMERLIASNAPPTIPLNKNSRAAILDVLTRGSSAIGDIAFHLGKDILSVQKHFPIENGVYRDILIGKVPLTSSHPKLYQGISSKLAAKFKKIIGL